MTSPGGPGREAAGDRTPQPDPTVLAALLRDLTGRQGWTRRLEGARVFEAWEQIAGPAVAAHAAPVRLVGGVLVVRASSPAWATQLRYLAGELAERANAVLGSGMVRQVTIVTDRDRPPGGRRANRR